MLDWVSLKMYVTFVCLFPNLVIVTRGTCLGVRVLMFCALIAISACPAVDRFDLICPLRFPIINHDILP